MRTVVVASGKGGTGKTTMTALFALLAARQGRVVVVDADVEASNLPIALGAAEEDSMPFSGMPVAAIDSGLCTQCGKCAEVCRFDAVAQGEDGAYLVDEWSCSGCGFCRHVCPSAAVEVHGRLAGAVCSSTSRVGPMAYGRLEPAADLSGRLVSEVRQLGSRQAASHGADLLIIDGPPGIGCPVIASLASTDLLIAVAEPTISGAHDLGRLLELAARFNLPAQVVLNKADLSDAGMLRIRRLCVERGVPLTAEIPFDPAVAGLLQSLAGGATSPNVMLAAFAEAARAWSRVEMALEST